MLNFLIFLKKLFSKKLKLNIIQNQQKNHYIRNQQSIPELSKLFSIGSHHQVIKGNIKIKLKEALKRNVSLIYSIPSKHHKNIIKKILNVWGDSSIMIPYYESFGISHEEAIQINLSQQRMANAALNAIKMQSIGLKKYKWLHTGSMDSCLDHLDLNGNIYSFDLPPVIDQKTGQRGYPGYLPECRCRMQPIIELS